MALPLQAVVFPTQLLLRADWPDGSTWLINPLNGERLARALLAVWLKGHLGMQAKVSEADLAVAENSQVVRRLLATLKTALMVPSQREIARYLNEAAAVSAMMKPTPMKHAQCNWSTKSCNTVTSVRV